MEVICSGGSNLNCCVGTPSRNCASTSTQIVSRTELGSGDCAIRAPRAVRSPARWISPLKWKCRMVSVMGVVPLPSRRPTRASSSRARSTARAHRGPGQAGTDLSTDRMNNKPTHDVHSSSAPPPASIDCTANVVKSGSKSTAREYVISCRRADRILLRYLHIDACRKRFNS